MSSKVSRLRKPSDEASPAPVRKSGRRAVVAIAKPRSARQPRKRGGRVAVRDSERTTAQILEAAIDLIESEGESGVRVHELARKAGRTMGAVYHHFESREGLIEAARALQFRGRSEEDILAIEQAVTRVGRTSLDLNVTIGRSDEPDVIYATGRSVLVWYDYQAGKSVPWPDSIRAAIS